MDTENKRAVWETFMKPYEEIKVKTHRNSIFTHLYTTTDSETGPK